MKRWLALLWLAAACSAPVRAEPLRVAVLMHGASPASQETEWRTALEAAQGEGAAFLVVNGLRAPEESCTDRLFRRRKAVLESADLPVFLSMAGSDWIGCRDRSDRPAGKVWLNLLRDQLYGGIRWSGSKEIELKRQSAMPAFRSYPENTRWSWRDTLFATLHMPAPNNHYLNAAGSNSEFEDRLIANREWLKRLSLEARQSKPAAIVLFVDGRPWPAPASDAGSRDGFAEMRAALKTFAEKAGAPVLLVQGSRSAGPAQQGQAGQLEWITLPRGLNLIEIDTAAALTFSVTTVAPPAP